MMRDESSIHVTARAYQTVASTYERGRPEYTAESVEALVRALNVRQQSVILDLGAGTGKFTKHLLRHSSHVTAVEPVAAMREKLAALLPQGVSDGSAESIPFPEQSFDCVFVANAFHWFDAPKALKEIYRVLKPGGGLGLIWLNDGVFSSDWGKTIDRMIGPYKNSAPQRESGVWRRAFAQTQLFSSLQESRLFHCREVTHELIVDRVSSLSFIAALPEAEKTAFMLKMRDFLSTHPKTAGQHQINVECDTDIYWCFKNR